MWYILHDLAIAFYCLFRIENVHNYMSLNHGLKRGLSNRGLFSDITICMQVLFMDYKTGTFVKKLWIDELIS